MSENINYVDPSKTKVSEHVKDGQKVTFQYFRDGEFWYKTDNGLLFPISLEEINGGKVTLLAEDKAIFFMRWIRKYISVNTPDTE